MDYGFVSCIPILVLITGALLTKKIGESMIVASVVGVAIVYKGGFFDDYVDTMYEVLTNESYQFILFIVLYFGAAVKLFQASGCLIGFGTLRFGAVFQLGCIYRRNCIGIASEFDLSLSDYIKGIPYMWFPISLIYALKGVNP